MKPYLSALASLALLTAAYWLVDLAVRRDGILHLLRRFGLPSPSWGITFCLLPCLAAAPFWRWDPIAQGESLRLLGATLTALLAWQAATRDHDPVVAGPRGKLRLLLLGLAAGVYASPAFLLATGFLLTTPFGLWQHHATLPMRLVQALMAQALLLPLAALHLFTTGLLADPAVPIFFLFTIAISHYLITALAKILLGPSWHSWATSNRLHHLAASAYSWGWARFLPWSTWLRFIHVLRRVEKPMQVLAFALELLSPLALLHPTAAIGFCLAWAGFHLGVFAVSGLLFWDWMLTDLALAVTVLLLPPSVAEAAFGPWQTVAAFVFMALFPLRHKLWKPMPLGWYDTPFTQRIHWRVRGRSGREYGLYNDFMCPHERLYGKVNGCFLAPMPVFTYHLGEVWKPELRDAIRAAGDDPARLEERLDVIRDRYGIHPRCGERSARRPALVESAGRSDFLLGRPARLPEARAGGEDHPALSRGVFRRRAFAEADGRPGDGGGDQYRVNPGRRSPGPRIDAQGA